MLLLFIIFKCTIFKFPLCSLHGFIMIIIILLFWVLEVILGKQKQKKKYWLFKRDHLESGLSVCVCFVSFSIIFSFSRWAPLVVISEATQLYYLVNHMTIRAGCWKEKKKRINICIFWLPKGAEEWGRGRPGGGLTCEYTTLKKREKRIKQNKKNKTASALQTTRKDTVTQRCNHTVIGYSFVCT